MPRSIHTYRYEIGNDTFLQALGTSPQRNESEGAERGGAFANAKERAAVAAEETAHKAKKTKVNREIKLLQKKISKIKHEFGPHIYDAMLDAINGNIGPEVDQLFNEARAKVDELNSEIESKPAPRAMRAAVRYR